MEVTLTGLLGGQPLAGDEGWTAIPPQLPASGIDFTALS